MGEDCSDSGEFACATCSPKRFLLTSVEDVCKQTPGRNYPFSEGVVELEFDDVDGEVVARIQGLGGEESELVKEDGKWKIWKARWNSGRGWR